LLEKLDFFTTLFYKKLNNMIVKFRSGLYHNHINYKRVL